MDTPNFICFAPYASRFPFETWIVPKNHNSHYENIQKNELDELGTVLKTILMKLEIALDKPSYNYIIHTSPFDTQALPHYHWHMEIIPRMTRIAGFEWGTGFYINSGAARAGGGVSARRGSGCDRADGNNHDQAFTFMRSLGPTRALNASQEIHHAHRHFRRNLRSGSYRPPDPGGAMPGTGEAGPGAVRARRFASAQAATAVDIVCSARGDAEPGDFRAMPRFASRNWKRIGPARATRSIR